MHVETAIVMIIGVVALTSLRLILALVGKEYDAENPSASIPRRDAVSDGYASTHVVRGTGRNSHLLYFPGELPADTADRPRRRSEAAPGTSAVVPLPTRQAS